MNGIGVWIAGVAIGAVLLASCATPAPDNSVAPAASLAHPTPAQESRSPTLGARLPFAFLPQ